jgi:hypothetical protein
MISAGLDEEVFGRSPADGDRDALYPAFAIM